MVACLRMALRHRGLTGTNPAVGTLIVDALGRVVGRGITARGGRPHAEPVALRQAGNRAEGATAYVTLEPCAHHGATPPCAEALVRAGVARVVTAWVDPDARVDGRGHAILSAAEIDVAQNVLAETAAAHLAGYLNRKMRTRPQVVLKLAVSADGAIGVAGQEVSITGPLARAYGHRMRAEVDAILVGTGTVKSDDPDLTCRLPGLHARSPHRFVLDGMASLPPQSRLAQTASEVPASIVSSVTALPRELTDLGVRLFNADMQAGKIALPEMLEDMAALGISSLLVEGGAKVASAFLDAGLITEIALFTSPSKIGQSGAIRSPVTLDTVPAGFSHQRSLLLGDDELHLFASSPFAA